MYMDKLENQKLMNHTNYRVVTLYADLILGIICVLFYFAYGYIRTIECICRRTNKFIIRVDYEMESLKGIQVKEEEN